MLDGQGWFSIWFSLGGALSYQSESEDHWKTFFSDSLWKSNILAIPHFSKMDSKRDHRGGHRNIYDQIDLEIINSKGPGPEKSFQNIMDFLRIVQRGVRIQNFEVRFSAV